MNHKALTDALPFLKSWLDYRARHADISGFSVAIQVDDDVVFSKAYGSGGTESTTPLTSGHLFHLASQSKMLTATAVLQFVQAGRLNLEDTVCNYLPWLRKHRDRRFCDITIRQLLCHSAGLPRDGLDSDYWLFQRLFPTRSQLQRMILGVELSFIPGASVKYSNLGFALLGQLLEALSGQPYPAHIRRAVVRPLGLSGIYSDYTAALLPRIPTGYGLPFDHQRKKFSPRLPTRSLAPAAGLYATPETMCQFAAALFTGNTLLLNDGLKQQARSPQATITTGRDAGSGFGLGYEFQTLGDRQLVGHTGHLGGHVSATFFDPDRRIAVSAACNTKDASGSSIVRGIFGALDFFQENRLPQPQDGLSCFDVRLYNDMSTIQIVHSGRALVAIDPDDWEPFAWPETLEKVNDTTLRVTTPGNIYNYNELVHYTFSERRPVRVRFGGLTLQAEI